MRVFCRVSLVLGVTLLTASVVQAQPPDKGGGPKGPRFGGGFGGRGGGGDPATLVRNPAVQKELKLTKAQLEKVDEAINKALAASLEPDQLKRLKQISLQMRGPGALADAKVQAELKLSGEQKENIKTIFADNAKKIRELMEEGPEGFTKMRELRKETSDKALGVLTASQREQWREMTGPEFRMGFGFGPGGGRFGKGPPKDKGKDG
jgi:hypothetical protein